MVCFSWTQQHRPVSMQMGNPRQNCVEVVYHACKRFIVKRLEHALCAVCGCAHAHMAARSTVGQTDWPFRILVRCRGRVRGWRLGGGEVEGSVTDRHLVLVARAVRVVPLSALIFDGLSCLFSFLLHFKHLKAAVQSLTSTSQDGCKKISHPKLQNNKNRNTLSLKLRDLFINLCLP